MAQIPIGKGSKMRPITSSQISRVNLNLAAPSRKSQSRPTLLQAAPAKVFHWLNIISLILMMTSGLQIYNANPFLVGAELAVSTLFLLGGWLAGGRHWHFAAMWLFALNLRYGIYIHHSSLEASIWEWQRPEGSTTSQNQKRKTYAWHRLVYTAIIPVLLLAVLSGLGMYKPVQFHWIDLFGSWWHYELFTITVPTVLIFAIAHPRSEGGGQRLIQSIFWSACVQFKFPVTRCYAANFSSSLDSPASAYLWWLRVELV